MEVGLSQPGAPVLVGAELPEDMPLDRFGWGSDFPHSVGTFPNSRDYIDETFGPLDDTLRHKILLGNAAEVLPDGASGWMSLVVDVADGEAPA